MCKWNIFTWMVVHQNQLSKWVIVLHLDHLLQLSSQIFSWIRILSSEKISYLNNFALFFLTPAATCNGLFHLWSSTWLLQHHHPWPLLWRKQMEPSSSDYSLMVGHSLWRRRLIIITLPIAWSKILTPIIPSFKIFSLKRFWMAISGTNYSRLVE